MELVKRNLKYLFLLIFFGVTVFVWYAVFAESRSGLTVAFLDVGQGDAIFIQAQNGNQILLDAGPDKKILRQLSKAMPFYDRSIDMIIESHPDSDHIGGFPDVLKNYNVALAMEPGVNSDNGVYAEVEKLIKEKNITKVLARRGMKIDMGGNTFLLILFPDRKVSGLDTNDASIVAKLLHGNNAFLLTGDSPQKMEQYLLSINPKDFDVNVLKVGHHGSKTSTSEALLGYTSPAYAVISAGKNNKYGHPHKEVLDKLEKFGVKILRTDQQGAIIFHSDGREIYVK